MAVQDFLNGGFYGKMGAVVGQRWHNKWTIRTYVKPKPSNSDAQIIWRETFAHAVSLTQQAMVINGHQGLWATPDNGEWANRMKYCVNKLKAGASDEEAIPIYPEGYPIGTKLTFQSCAFKGNNEWELSFSGNDITEPRQIKISFDYNSYDLYYKRQETFDQTLQPGQTSLTFTSYDTPRWGTFYNVYIVNTDYQGDQSKSIDLSDNETLTVIDPANLILFEFAPLPTKSGDVITFPVNRVSGSGEFTGNITIDLEFFLQGGNFYRNQYTLTVNTAGLTQLDISSSDIAASDLIDGWIVATPETYVPGGKELIFSLKKLLVENWT